MKLSVVKGTTSLSTTIFIADSSVTTGAGKTGLVFNTPSLVAYYVQPRGTPTAITLATLANAQAAYSSGGFVEVDSVNMPGIYRVDIPNAALTGADSVVVMIKGAAGMVPVAYEIELTGVDNMDAAAFGMSRLDAAMSSRSTITTAQVNAEVVDALTIDTYAEPGGAPAATSSLKDKIGWLFKLSRNLRKTTSATDSVYNDAGAVVDSTSAISDDGTTFTRGEYT